MAIEHILTDIDSLPSLALHYLGDATRWPEIADYNNISYPYLLKDYSELLDFYGSGYVTIVRANYISPVTIKAGWTFTTKPGISISGVAKVFKVTEDTLIPSGVSTWQVPVRCTISGSFGNVPANTITEVGSNTLQLSGMQFLSVANNLSFTNGIDTQVLVTGESIYIPTDSAEVIPENTNKMLAFIGGEDLVFDADGDVSFEVSGDLASVVGEDNIRYAVAARLATELGEYTLHPDYGTGFQELIGSPNIANREKLMEIKVLKSLSAEDRIKDALINSLSIDKTSVYIDIGYTISVTNKVVSSSKFVV